MIKFRHVCEMDKQTTSDWNGTKERMSNCRGRTSNGDGGEDVDVDVDIDIDADGT